jgi:signal transduction protein with GAF and PtsI domain
MYDPMIVDTFFKVHGMAPQALPRQGPASEVLNTITHSRRMARSVSSSSSGRLEGSVPTADEILSVHELARSLAGQVSLNDAAEVIAKHLRLLMPSSLCVFYLHDSVCGELEARYAVGDGASLVRGMRIALGQRLSGWVGANRQTICNSDAALDLGERAGTPSLTLRSGLSTALIRDDELIGVLSLYSAELNGFNDDHSRIVEALAGEIANAFKSASEFNSISSRDVMTGLPELKLKPLKQFADAT